MSGFVRQPYGAWGRTTRADAMMARPQYRGQLDALIAEAGAERGDVLAVGLGRSYGDSGLNGRMICGRALDRFISFDENAGVLRAEGGASLDAILRLVVPRGWFLPTTPGTRFVTLGGAVANDVHGRNHLRAGSIGCHVRAIGLLRSDQGRVEVSPDSEPELFYATLGGLGLTGFIEWVELSLTQIPSGFLDEEALSFASIEDYLTLVQDSDARFEHVAAWIDCSASGRSLGRGVMFRANWRAEGGLVPHGPKIKAKVPFEAPNWALNPLSIRVFNTLIYERRAARRLVGKAPYAAVFYPLDAIGDWNKLYGSRGFYQHQCVIPRDQASVAIRELLGVIAASGQGSFLAVLKSLGPRDSGGLISFPTAGTTLALDFPNRGPATLDLLAQLDAIVVAAGGRIYPAKDGRMSAAAFQSGYPRWRELEARRDPLFQSAFWRRVTT